QEIAIFEENNYLFKALDIAKSTYRFYYLSQDMCHIVGYTGNICSNKNSNINKPDNFTVGQVGLEKYYQNSLEGVFGYRQIEVDSKANIIRKIQTNNPLPGNNIHISINSKIQKNLTDLLDPAGGSAIVMNVENGAITALSSTPTFDTNKLIKFDNNYWKEIINDSNLPLINKSIKKLYAPGSIFKLVIIFAALEFGIDPSQKFFCSGKPYFSGNSFRCSKYSGHRNINMYDAVKYSCNHYIYNIVKIIGIDNIIDIAKKFGFGSKTGIDLPGEAKGLLPTPQWKFNKYKEKWRTGDSFNLAMGQGFILATPIQMARFITAIASGGELFTPSIAQCNISSTSNSNTGNNSGNKLNTRSKIVDIKKSNINIVQRMLYRVVNEKGGTGYKNARLAHAYHQMAGKTGTAQVIAKSSVNNNLSSLSVKRKFRNHSTFIGYAPYNNPSHTVTVFADHGGNGGGVASSIARKITDDILH
ncbi:MAG TPA: penicillin-binding protein 2, partial [Candidatus Megaira endosymbiont of Hartmannula sinica]|nr:penicillin-binding protein 2 [Candidatus Megaera endosymbiont of Hartmannula sinica]